MKTYALVNNNVVTNVVEISDDDLLRISRTNHMVIDVTDQLPRPTIGYVLNGNILELPRNQSSREQFEIDLAIRKMDFGTELSKRAIAIMGARNKILDKTGAQVTAVLNSLLGLKLLMETGALGTARANCVQLKVVFTEYEDIFQKVIDEINVFEQTFGL